MAYLKLLKKFISCSLLLGVIITSFSPVQAHASTIEENNIKSSISINDDDVVESKLLTYDELVNEVVKNENLSVEDAKKFLGVNDKLRNGEYYRTYTYTVQVTSAYKPTVVFYCKTSEWNNYRGIISVLNTSLNRSYNGLSKQFSGTLYTNLENAYTIYFELNGDFYNNGTTTFSGGGEIEVGGKSTINFGVSYATNHFSYCYKTGRYALY